MLHKEGSPMDFILILPELPHHIESTQLDTSKYFFLTNLRPTFSWSITLSCYLIVCQWNWMIGGIICLLKMCVTCQSNFNFIKNRYIFSLYWLNHFQLKFKLLYLCVSTANLSGGGVTRNHNGHNTMSRNIFGLLWIFEGF